MAAVGEGGRIARTGHWEPRTSEQQIVEQMRVMMAVSFFTKEGPFPSFQRFWDIFSVISLFHRQLGVLAVWEAGKRVERGHDFWESGLRLPAVWQWVSYLTFLLLLGLIYKMRIIISTLQGCCQNLKCLAIISKGPAPMTWTCSLAEGFPLVQLLEKQGNVLLFCVLAVLPDMIKQTWGGGGDSKPILCLQ